MRSEQSSADGAPTIVQTNTWDCDWHPTVVSETEVRSRKISNMGATRSKIASRTIKAEWSTAFSILCSRAFIRSFVRSSSWRRGKQYLHNRFRV
eukprot:scaffold1143_cov177-Amphora_coffeaeformis.AAC.22